MSVKGQSTNTLKVPTITTQSETQTLGHLVQKQTELTDTMDQSNQNLRKRRNLSKNRSQAAKQREQTPEPGRTPVHEDTTTTSEDDEPKTVRSSREIEADKTYEEVKRLVEEQSRAKDPEYDIDMDEILEKRLMAESERRRRSISPFAIPDKEEISALQRKGSFIDPGNKLLSANYTLSPMKDEDPVRRNSLTIESSSSRKNSLTPPSGSPREGQGFVFPQAPPKKLDPIIYPDEPKPQSTNESNKAKQLKTPTKKETNAFPFEDIESKSTKTSQPSPPSKLESQSGELVTKVIQVERTPSKKLNPEEKPQVEVRSRVVRTPSKKLAQEIKPVLQKPIKTESQSTPKLPPVKPARSKSATRFGARTSESEMSEDQMRLQSVELSSRRKVIPTPKRFIKNRSPRAKRSQSLNKVEDMSSQKQPQELDRTATGMSKTSLEIIELMKQARARSLSIPKDDTKIPKEYREHKILQTPNKTPSNLRQARGVSCPKTIQIISGNEILASLSKVQKLDLQFEARRKPGYVSASQSEYTSSCYSSSPSDNEKDFNLSDKTAELTRKLSLLSQEQHDASDPKTGTVLRRLHKGHSRKQSLQENKTKKHMSSEENDKSEENHKKTVKYSKIRQAWREFKTEQRHCYNLIKSDCKRCVCDLIFIIIFCGLGGMLFKNLEGSFENAFKCGSRSVKRDFIESLWKGSHYLREDEWRSLARQKLFEFEQQLYAAHEAGLSSYSGRSSWNFMNSFVYCLTIITSIGYGHIAPSTTQGRIATIVYAIVGIPLFLIVLADFGKLFTRIIKFLWAFVRRVYYTGSCRKVRRTAPMQEMMKGLNIMYDVVRRPSQMFDGAELPPASQHPPSQHPPSQHPLSQHPPKQDSNLEHPPFVSDIEAATEPQTPAPSAFEIDDEFNLPISLAIVILIIYILLGALGYSVVEKNWTFFESFYFVFISMTTIGLGDLVPNHPMYMMASILYLVFGLALTSMCINVVQLKLSDTFKQASAKLGATIGLQVADEDGSLVPIPPDGSADSAPAPAPGSKPRRDTPPESPVQIEQPDCNDN